MSPKKSRLNIGGVSPPIATPFNADESINFDKLEVNVKKWNGMNFTGYVVQGSNGEYVYLSPEERVEFVRKVKDFAAPGKLIIAGSGCESTRETIMMSKKMADVGADAVIVVTPCYYKGSMTNTALIQHYTKVADQSPVPVILYSVPGNTGIDLSPEVVLKLSSHPNVIGLKDSGGDISKIANMVFQTKSNDFQILAGSAGFLLPALAVGCVGGVCALANVLGEETCQLQELFESSKMTEAQILQQRLVGPNLAVTRQFGVPGLKQAMDWFGFYGGPVRSPLVPLTQSEQTTLREAYKTSGFLTD